jgi:chromosome segregation ATPase
MKGLAWINLCGAIALAMLCSVQWHRNRHLNLDFNQVERVRLEQEQEIARQKKDAEEMAKDLAVIKEQFRQTHAEATETRAALRKSDQENAQLAREREQLKESVAKWSAAFAERDEMLEKVNEQLRETSARLNESILKFNELATNYNASVGRFNELATNYNSVVTQLNELRTRGRPAAPKP